MKYYIVELAGRDSYAALYKTIEMIATGPDVESYIIPIELKTPFEYRESGIDLDYIKCRLMTVLDRYGIGYNRNTYAAMYDKLNNSAEFVDEENELWAKLCMPTARYIKALGTFCPCTGCHLFCHLARINRFIKCYGNIMGEDDEFILVTGERRTHNGTIKQNQTENVIEDYKKLIIMANYEMDIKYLPIVYDIGSDIDIDFLFRTMCILLEYKPEELAYSFYKCPMSKLFANEKNKALTGSIIDAIDLGHISYANFIHKA